MPKRKPEETNTNGNSTPCAPIGYVSKTIEARVRVNMKRLDAAILATGRSERDICEDAMIEPRNLSNWRKGRRALRGTLEALTSVLEIDVRELILEDTPPAEANNAQHAPLPFVVRKISGKWTIDGEDVVAPPNFVYKVPPKPLGGTIELFQNGLEIKGEGFDHEAAPLDFDGEFIGPDHIRGTYDIHHPRMGILSGVMVGTYQRCGTKINGHYLGREAGGYGQDFLLGKFTLTLIGSRDA